MVQAAVTNTHHRCAHSERSTRQRVRSATRVTLLCGLVHKLIESREYLHCSVPVPTSCISTHVVAKLNLCYGRGSNTRQANAETCDTLLSQGRVKDPLLACDVSLPITFRFKSLTKLFSKTLGASAVMVSIGLESHSQYTMRLHIFTEDEALRV